MGAVGSELLPYFLIALRGIPNLDFSSLIANSKYYAGEILEMRCFRFDLLEWQQLGSWTISFC